MSVRDRTLTVSGASVRFRGRWRNEGIEALRNVSIEVKPGQTVGIVGESGSGKSTLARAILGLQRLDEGTIRLGDKVISNLPPRQRREVGREVQGIFQDPYNSLNPARLIGRVLLEELLLRNPRVERPKEHVQQMVMRLGLPASVLSAYPRELSGGQRQRVSIARAMICPPSVMVCDEPVTSLDLTVQAQVLNLLKKLQREEGISYLFIGHDLAVVRHMSDEIVVLYKGQILEKGAAEAVTLEPAHPYTLALQASAGLVAGHRTTTPERPTQAASRATGTEATLHLGCIFKNSCPWRADRCDIERPELRTVESVHVACHRAEEVRANTAINAPGGESARVPSRSS